MSINGDLDAIEAQVIEIVGDPDRVFQYAPEEPYKGRFPFYQVGNMLYVTTWLANSRLAKGNPDGEPNEYYVEVVDQLTSLSGSTLRATMRALNDFVERLTVYYTVVEHQCWPNGSYMVGGTVRAQANPDGPYDIKTEGLPVILSRITVTARQAVRRPPE